MGRKHLSGLLKRGQIWHINKKVNGRRICESTGTSDLQEAESYLAHKLEAIRQATVYGVRPKRSFREAALKFVGDHGHKATLCDNITTIKQLDPYIGKLRLEAVHMGSLQAYIDDRKDEGVKSRTINHGLQLVRRILNLAAQEWLDEHGLTWLEHAPKIKILSEKDKRKPYPLSWEEQELLFKALPAHLAKMALFAVNTGCRDAEICGLRWEWEIALDEKHSVFVIPGPGVKNREDRLVILNDFAQALIEEVRGQHSVYVFTYRQRRLYRMLNSGWQAAREKTGLDVRVHDLKHTFGRRLRAAGVKFEDRQDLLGHKSKRITTHYSAPEVANLLSAANKVCQQIPLLVLNAKVRGITEEATLKQTRKNLKLANRMASFHALLSGNAREATE